MFRKVGLAIFAIASIAAVTPASADGISGEEGVRRTRVEYREHYRRDDGYRRVHRVEHRDDYVEDDRRCWRVKWTDVGPRRVDTPCN